MQKAYVNNLKGLDILRFILSIVVVIYHYQHFYFPFINIEDYAKYQSKEPFFAVLKYVYIYGFHAVPVFWLISGIIFFKVYKKPLENNAISFKNYIINRISRLYPLHFITLILVAVLQYLMLHHYQKYFVYPENGAQAFFQNLFFVQSWGVNKFSFNGPVWSVSVEIFVYISFFLLCVSGFLKRRWLFILVLISLITVKKWELIFINGDIRFSLMLFFLGGALINIYDKIKDKLLLQVSLLTLFVALWLFSVSTPNSLSFIYNKVTGNLNLDITLFAISAVLGFIIFFNLPIFNNLKPKYFKFWGDMTYSTYLIHFPIQITIFMVLKPQNYEYFFNGNIFLAYLAIVLILGRLTYIYVEVPLQSLIRKKFLDKPSIKA